MDALNVGRRACVVVGIIRILGKRTRALYNTALFENLCLVYLVGRRHGHFAHRSWIDVAQIQAGGLPDFDHAARRVLHTQGIIFMVRHDVLPVCERK